MPLCIYMYSRCVYTHMFPYTYIYIYIWKWLILHVKYVASFVKPTILVAPYYYFLFRQCVFELWAASSWDISTFSELCVFFYFGTNTCTKRCVSTFGSFDVFGKRVTFVCRLHVKFLVLGVPHIFVFALHELIILFRLPADGPRPHGGGEPARSCIAMR